MATQVTSDGCPLIQRVVSVLWPSFLAAGLATVLFFAAFDPDEFWPDSSLGRLGVYTVGFFSFWGLTAVSSAMTCYFRTPCPSVSSHTSAR